MSSVLHNPLIETSHTRYGRSHSDSMANVFLEQTPRSLTNSVDSLTRKRKIDVIDSDNYKTPVKAKNASNMDFLITPPGANDEPLCYKRSKTVPSSPIGHHHQHHSYLPSPCTPLSSNKLNFTTNLSTPPSSSRSSPKLAKLKLHRSNVASKMNNLPGYSNFFGDTCYSFNLSSSSLCKGNESNIRATNWRDACQDKVKHQSNQQFKKFQQQSTEFKSSVQEKYKATMNPPQLFSSTLFPNINKVHSFVGKQYEYYNSLVNYPFTADIENNHNDFRRDYEVLLNNPDLETFDPPRLHSLIQSSNQFKLPPINQILNSCAMDKAGLHPLGLTNTEMKSYNDLSKYSISLAGDARRYYANQLPLKTDIQINHTIGHNMFPEDNYVQFDNSIDYSNEPLSSHPFNEALLSPITASSLNKVEQHHNRPALIITKTRKTSTVSKSSKKSASRKSSVSSSQRGRTQKKKISSRSSSRSSSISKRLRTRSSSRQREQDETSTVELSLSTSSAKKHKINYVNSSEPKFLVNDSAADNANEPALKTQTEEFRFHNHNINTQNFSHSSHTQHNIYHNHSSKKCLSCGSSNSPCWRPSWNPELGQLCNSCGLRYRKTKARCMNAECLRIPAKSEWGLMQRRGKVNITIPGIDNVPMELNCYKCLQCDYAMEVKN